MGRVARVVWTSLVALTVPLGMPLASAQQPREPLELHLFYSPSCPHCHPVRELLSRLEAERPDLVVHQHSLTEADNIELMVDYYVSYQVPEERWGGTMAAFVGDRWWSDDEEILTEIEPAVLELLEAGSGEAVSAEGKGHERLVALFERFGVVTVAAAGLADGVNPCALAALAFLISFLSFAGRGPAEILGTGLLFAAGVFLACLGVGLGLFKGLQALSGLTTLSRLLYPLMAAGTLALAGLSFRDYLRARAGGAQEMTLRLPRRLLRASHGTVRKLLGGPGFLALAFVAGAAVSLLELFCTGQVYLPTLVYVASTERLRARAIPLLVLYVAMFTMPVVALSIAAYAGSSSERIGRWAREHTAATKAALTVVFLLLGVGLSVFSVHVWLG
ncbi:MAG: hypothetical protein ACP5KN_20265 [Armatimonadota bacterium]